MNLLENEEQIEKTRKTRTIMAIIILLIVLLLLACGIILFAISNIQKGMLKVTIDGKSKTNVAEDIFLVQNDNIYISIKEFAKLVGYEGITGDHKSNDSTKCYIQNEYEEASFELNSKRIYKKLMTGTDNEYYDLAEPVKMVNNKLYVNLEGMQIASNTLISYDAENNHFKIFTLPYLTTYYTDQINNAIITGKDADFSNQKAVRYEMIVVRNESGKYGVYGTDKKEIIGTKYLAIKFVETTQDFIITTDDNKMGIIAKDGTTKIEPIYDKIKQIDRDLNYYIVENKGKQAIVDHLGNIIIYLEYEKIGVDLAQFENNNIKIQYLLFDNCIPVQRNKKWGLYDKTGKQIVPVEYDGLGCIAGTQASTAVKNLLIIPKYECIVVQKNNKFGLVNSLGRELLPCILDSIYVETISGQDTYYMTQGEGEPLNVIDFLEEYILKPEEIEQNSNSIINETIDNGVSNYITDTNNIQTNITTNVTNTTQTPQM